MKLFITFLTAIVFLSSCTFAASAGFKPGGAAEIPAIDSFSTWTQFSSPDTQTPAIDETGCLDYSLAKIAVRYNLPLTNVDVFDSSYEYYTEFVAEAIHPAYTKAIYFSEYFSPYLHFAEHAEILASTAVESWKKTYEYCYQMQLKSPSAFVLEMTTASGSSHFVAVNTINETEERLYLYDSGDRFSEYLGDSVSESHGYYVKSVYTMQILSMPGDVDKDFQITWTDAFLLNLMLGFGIDNIANGDANHNGTADAADVRYIEKYAQHIQASS